MREIKFRAWHTKANKMFSAEELGQDEMTLAVDGRGFVNVSGTSTRLSQYISEMIPMQYTGLKDKNGKEIYEGDIIKYQTVSGFDAHDTYEEIEEVRFIDGAFVPLYLSTRDLHTYDDELLIVEKIEVIGNIYENPELLK